MLFSCLKPSARPLPSLSNRLSPFFFSTWPNKYSNVTDHQAAVQRHMALEVVEDIQVVLAVDTLVDQ